MTMQNVVRVSASEPKPFKTLPYITLVIEGQEGVGISYVQKLPEDTPFDDIVAEVHAIAEAGVIDQAELDEFWSVSSDIDEIEQAMIDGDAEDSAFQENGPPEVEIDNEEELEPLV